MHKTMTITLLSVMLSTASAHDCENQKTEAASIEAATTPKVDYLEQTAQIFDERAFPLAAAKWEIKKIPVCWEATSMYPEYAAGRRTVQNAVKEQWEANSSLVFTGWEQCVDSNRGIRILVEDSGPHVKKLGSELDGIKNGMVLNFTYQNWSTSCQSSKEYCTYVIAVHEFGHALFFAHEQNRPDTPGECNEPKQGTNGDTITLTPWDWSSVMNYCNPIYSNDGQLSDWDIFALQKYYGRPAS